VGKRFVNNESSEIIRIFNTVFNDNFIAPEKAKVDIYPAEYHAEIDALNEWIFPTVNSVS
jgi:putative glutathione S-transferase